MFVPARLSSCLAAVAVLFIAAMGRPAAAQSPECAAPVGAGATERLSGRVLDPSSGAVAGAVVLVECGIVQFATVSDAAGRYAVEVQPGRYNLHVSRDGFTPAFESLVVERGAALVRDLTLAVSTFTEAVTVTAGGFEQIVRTAPATVSVLARADLETRRFASLAQALVDVEGVDVGQDVGKTGGMTISMRGMPSDYTLILIDGRRQNSAGSVTPNGFGETSTSFMPPLGAIERIEVVRGPMSTLYGSDAMGGVVNVITRKVSTRWTGQVVADGTVQGNRDYGDTAQGTAFVSGPLVANTLGVTARGSIFRRQAAALNYETVAGAEVPITGFGLSPTRADIHNAGGRLTYLPHRDHELYVDVDAMWQDYDNRQRQLGTVGVQGGYEERLRFNRQQMLVAHTGRFRLGVLDSSLTRNTTETIGRTIPPGTPGRVAGAARTLEATNTIGDTKLVMALGRHTLSVGGQWWHADMVDAVAPAPYTHTQGAVFAEDEWRIVPRLSATAGLRYDRHNTFGDNLSPRAYLVFTPLTDVTVKGGISRGFKTPQLNQLATGIVGFGAQGTLPLIGSPGLEPETSTSAEIGAYVTRGVFSGNVTFFNNEFQDKIASGPGLENCSFRGSPDRPGCVDFGSWPNVDLFGQQINVDEAVTRGVEAAARLTFGRVSVMQNYTLTESEQRSGAQAGQPLVNTPRHMYNAQLRTAVTQALSTWLRVEARSSRTRGTSAAALAATEQIGAFKAYGLVHLGGAYRLTSALTANLTVYNLLDTDFLNYQPYVSNNVVAYASEFNNLQEPRRLWLSLSYAF